MNEPDKLSNTIEIFRGEHAGKKAYVTQYDWASNKIRARLNKDEPRSIIEVRFEDVIFLKEKKEMRNKAC